jgi:hypothetical protein
MQTFWTNGGLKYCGGCKAMDYRDYAPFNLGTEQKYGGEEIEEN